MTNAQIIGNASLELLKAGKIRGTGRTLKVIDAAGNVTTLPEPEEIHTYQTWLDLGYQVQRGQRAVAKITIWKHTTRKVKAEDGSETETEHMFPKNSAFFARHQVAPITA